MILTELVQDILTTSMESVNYDIDLFRMPWNILKDYLMDNQSIIDNSELEQYIIKIEKGPRTYRLLLDILVKFGTRQERKWWSEQYRQERKLYLSKRKWILNKYLNLLCTGQRLNNCIQFLSGRPPTNSA